MNREEALERAIELKDHSEKFESVSYLESDTEFFDYVIKELERTAQEVPVQEQSIKDILSEISVLLITANSIIKKLSESKFIDSYVSIDSFSETLTSMLSSTLRTSDKTLNNSSLANSCDSISANTVDVSKDNLPLVE